MYYRPKIFFPKKTYSTFGEDQIIKKFFNNKSKGFYVDIGCYHPLDGSNTYLLYKKGWRGINIDVNSLSIELFKNARREDENINVAVSNVAKKIKIYFRKKINMLNTTSKKLAKIHFRNGYQEKLIKSDTLNSILKRSKFKNRNIDFLNIDVEGNELNVLKAINFKKYSPTLICVEIHNHEDMYNQKTDYLKRNPIYKFLKSKKYRVFWKSEFSFIFKV
jgi:FkbM family methyltransferase